MRTIASSSRHGETVARLLEAITERGLVLFAQLDHAAAAREAGLEMRDELVVVFGNPRAGTPLMRADPRIGIELPMRILVWDEDGRTMIGYNDPETLTETYDVTPQAATLDAMSSLLGALARQAAGRPA